ncbi:MAG: NAD-dependent epimerase/dehydratase family protein [Proteobacteria bacterium]|nr:NAD-dependent epimerase/dehydratase family protein [Pseudomonadota bacterium]
MHDAPPPAKPSPAALRQAGAPPSRPVALVFGGSGQVGRPLLARLVTAGWDVRAMSRGAQTAWPGVRWIQGGLPDRMPSLAPADVVFSCGPLDAFAAGFARGAVEGKRVVAFGSTSVGVKQASADPDERDVAARLRQAEALLFDSAARLGVAATVLRPTLVYGAGRDATLTRIAMLARRLRGFALPADATGLRQPVHVDDLADAAIACLEAPAAHGRAYALPGGEALPYREMVARVLASLPSSPRLVSLPPPLFRALLAPARWAGVASGFNNAALARLREDLVFDAAPARVDFGYAPRAFAPDAAMFTPPA